jgi:uncharacterized repeat protein (TIGR01451 family)
MTRAFSLLCRRPATRVVPALAVVLLLSQAALAQKVGVNCLADGGSNCTELIPDGTGSLASTVMVPAGCSSIARVCVALGVEHSEMSDLTIGLSHNATSAGITGSTSPDLLRGQVFETEFDGQDGSGMWTLTLRDGTNGDYGALNNWVLGLCCGADCGDGLVRVSPVSGLITTEAGGMAQFSVELTCPPFREVTIPGIASTDTTEGVADKSSLVFNAGNWTIPQTVTSTGQDDALLDGDIPYNIPLGMAALGAAFAALGDPADLYNPPSLYAGVNAAGVALVNLDDETDLALEKKLVTTGPPAIYTITATNEGPGTVMGATVTDNFPAGFTCTWTCVGAGGGTCTAAGAGNINDVVDLPPGASVTYTAACAYSGSVNFANTASVAPPGGSTDVDPSDNSDSVEPILVPAPAPALGPWGIALALLAIAVVAWRRMTASG